MAPPKHRYVLHMVTKLRYKHKPTLESMRAALHSLRDACMALKLDTIAMPTIGCGLDQLHWDDVQQEIKHAFAGSGVRVLVYTLEPV